jgi:hypothetical protein
MNAKALKAFAEDPRFALPAELHILTERQTAAFLNVCVRTLQGWRAAGAGPPWVRVGPGCGRIGYARSDVLAHIKACKFSSAAAEELARETQALME